MTTRYRLFPLQSVLVPGAPLPLHVFEERYQVLLNDTLEDDRSFGVVWISQGREVGGGDQRVNIGTKALIQEHQRFDDGRAAVMALGTERFRVVEWLPDDPYPCAMAEAYHDESVDSPAVAAQGFAETNAALERMLDTAARLGRLGGRPAYEWAEDPDQATWQLTRAAPLSTLDQQQVLECRSLSERHERLVDLFDGMALHLEAMGHVDEDT